MARGVYLSAILRGTSCARRPRNEFDSVSGRLGPLSLEGSHTSVKRTGKTAAVRRLLRTRYAPEEKREKRTENRHCAGGTAVFHWKFQYRERET